MFTLGMYGKGDFFDMKGVCEEFFEKIGMKKKVTYDPNSGKPFLHPGRQANMIYEGKVVGYLGEVHPAVADNYSIGEKAYIAVIDILDVLEFAGFNHKYTGIAKYPAVTRDLSLVVPHAVLAGQIEEIFDREAEIFLRVISCSISTRAHRLRKVSNPWLILWYSVPMTRLLVKTRSPQQ